MLTLVAGDEFDGPFDGLTPGFEARLDAFLWELQLAEDATGEGGELEPFTLPCTHPDAMRAVLDEALPLGDSDRVEVCGVCGGERAGGRWVA